MDKLDYLRRIVNESLADITGNRKPQQQPVQQPLQQETPVQAPEKPAQEEKPKKTYFLHLNCVLSKNQVGTEYFTMKVGLLAEEDARALADDQIRVVTANTGFVKNMKTGNFVTQGKGKFDMRKPLKGYFLQFPSVELENGRDGLRNSLIRWLKQNPMFSETIDKLANSNNAIYKFGPKKEEGEADQTQILTPETARDCKNYLSTEMYTNTIDAPTREYNEIIKKEIDDLKGEIYQLFVSGDIASAMEKTGYLLRKIDAKYGHQLAPKNVMAITAHATAAGLTPNSPNWPTFVRSRVAWRRMGFLVCDDPQLAQYNLQGYPRDPMMEYPMDAATTARATASSLKAGANLIGQNGLPLRNKQGVLTQIGDKAKIETAPVTGGVHGLGYDKTDVVPMPGTITWAEWHAAPGLINNLLGELNDPALEEQEKREEEYNQKKAELDDLMRNDPEAEDKINAANAEDRQAIEYNEAIKSLVEDNKLQVKVAQSGNNVKDYVSNIRSLTNVYAAKMGFTKSKENIANGALVCIVHLSVGKEYISNYITNLNGVTSLFSGAEGKKEFTDGVWSITFGIINEINKYLRDNAREKDKVVTAGVVNEETVGGGVSPIKVPTKDDIADILGIDFNDSENILSESKLKAAYYNLLDRMNNLYSDND